MRRWRILFELAAGEFGVRIHISLRKMASLPRRLNAAVLACAKTVKRRR
jgi:hypothetical protein